MRVNSAEVNLIDRLLSAKQYTLLCSGPMSKNCIDASIDIARQHKVAQVLIASRRQIDPAEFGGGYGAQY